MGKKMRGMPIMAKGALPLPWSIIEPHEAQALKNHGQTLERLAERGGLSACEAVAILEDRSWHRMSEEDAFIRLANIVKEATERIDE